jgi:hypothetical protein
VLGLDVSQLNHLPPDLATKLHGLAKGAFTADQDEVIIGTVDLLEMPVVSTTVLVKVAWVSSSAFYITPMSPVKYLVSRSWTSTKNM